MNHFKKITAAICAVAVAVSIAGCADVSTIGSIDNKTINAGIYLIYEQTAMSEAQEMIDSTLEAASGSSGTGTTTDYFTKTIEGKTYSQYVQDRTLDLVKQHVAIENKFNELGLTLTDEEKSEVTDSVKEMWDTEITYNGYYSTGVTYGESYEDAGISRKSFEAVRLNRKMSNKVFDAYYEENGITATDEQDIATYFYDNYGRFQIIQVSLTEGNGDDITTDEGKKAKKEQAQGYVDRLVAGEDYETIYHEYEAQVEKEKAEAEAESNSSASSEDTASDTSSEASTDSSTDSTTTSDDDHEDEEEHDHEFMLGKTDTSPSEEFIKWAFELENGKGGVYEDDTIYYAVVRRDIKEREDWLLKNRSNILHLMKDDEFEAMLDETAKDYALDLNNDALNRYKPENLKGI